MMALVAFGAGCAGWQGRVINQASFDHECPEEDVTILRDSGDRMARTVDLDVCGARKRYQDRGGNVYLWQDITDEQSE